MQRHLRSIQWLTAWGLASTFGLIACGGEVQDLDDTGQSSAAIVNGTAVSAAQASNLGMVALYHREETSTGAAGPWFGRPCSATIIAHRLNTAYILTARHCITRTGEVDAAPAPASWLMVVVKTGLGSFGFAAAALLLTTVGALVLLLEVGRGRRPPLPLHEGTLLAAAGIWSALIVAFLMIDRPDFTLRGFSDEYNLGYGIFVALAGAGLLALAGLRVRRLEARDER